MSEQLDWTVLDQPRPRAIHLSPAARARLAHLAELRDISGPAEASRATAEFAGERWFAADLLSVRPWLSWDTPKRDVLSAMLDTEWTGFLGLLGEYGPWVYAGSVRDLQTLSARYGALVAAASHTSEQWVWTAARRSADHPSLLGRLEATDYRQPTSAVPDLAALEAAFWHEARAQAQLRHDRWQARRS